MARTRRNLLLRVANVNPEHVRSHSDRALYRSIGVFILLYFVYATAGAAAFVDASSNYAHPWWQWLVGVPVAAAVVAYDRAVVGRVAVNLEDLDSDDPDRLLRRRTFGLYAGRLLLALLFAVVITEPLMLTRYKGEIDAHLADVHAAKIGRLETGGLIATLEAQLTELRGQDAADERAVAELHQRAADKRAEAATVYRQALDDSAADGVSRRAGCPPGGFCDTLVQRSRALGEEASRLDEQARQVQQTQTPGREARARQAALLTTDIQRQREVNRATVAADAGFGARTKAMWHLARSDFWGLGFFYLGVAALLVALDCAAIWLKLVSHGNAYERTEARQARLRELRDTVRQRRELRLAGTAADVAEDGLTAAAAEQRLIETAVARARTRLQAELEAF